jgi:hypothetical protein
MKRDRDLSCAEIVELVTEYLEGGLMTVDRERFEEHIAYCNGCLVYLEQMRQTVAEAGRLSPDELPRALQESLLAAFRDWSNE